MTTEDIRQIVSDPFHILGDWDIDTLLSLSREVDYLRKERKRLQNELTRVIREGNRIIHEQRYKLLSIQARICPHNKS